MRIVYLANSRWPRMRGAERLLLALLEHGRSQGHRVSVVAPPGSGLHAACTAAGIRSDEAEFRLTMSAVSRLRGLLRDLQPDVVHGMSIFPVAFVRRLRLVPHPAEVRFFAYASIDPTSTLPVAAERFRGFLLFLRNSVSRREAPRLDVVFTASETVARRLGQAGIRGRFVAIPGRIDPGRLAAEAAQPRTLPPGRPRIGYAGYLEPLKGVDDLISAFAEVALRHAEAVLLVGGDGPDRGRLLDFARAKGVADRVTLLGFLDPVAPLLASLDVFVSPSHSEALGTSILEAMALGVPCVCTDSGGPAEFISDGVNGLLVPPCEPAALAAAVSRLLDDPSEAAHLAAAGRATAHEHRFLLSSALEAVFAEYERTVRSSSDAA